MEEKQNWTTDLTNWGCGDKVTKTLLLKTQP